MYFNVKYQAGGFVSTSGYTHIELAVRLHGEEGETGLYIGAQDLAIHGGKHIITKLNSPYYTNEGLVTDQGYRLFRVPLADLRPTNRDYLAVVWLMASGRPITIYVDSVRLVTFDVEAYSAPLWTRTGFEAPPPNLNASAVVSSSLLFALACLLLVYFAL